jgi:putative tricarboxylic transport membrane protein
VFAVAEPGRRELGAAAFLIAFGALVVAITLGTIGSGVQTDPLGPRAMPLAVGGGIALCGVLLLVGAALGTGRRAALLAEGPGEEEDPGPVSPSRLAGAVLATAIYVAVFETLGHLLATPLYVAALLLLHGGVPRRALLAAPVLVGLALYAGFRLGLNVPLPGGILETLFLR